ncbi:MAG TPA: uroporphyrinogen decarboxylase family protein [Thermoguttaceae bacterium]|nr:uroporphyrinogen decarboxylase family protein [Thermoguttaceae bacterium]
MMEPREIVRRAIEFDRPPRLPFWQHWNHKMADFPDDVHNIWEMDRQEAGWFFDNPNAADDWGCGWNSTEHKTIGQVTEFPLADWSSLDRYQAPDPRNPFYYDRLGPMIDAAGDRYVAITAHSLLFSRQHKLRGFANTMEDFYFEPERVNRLLDMIVDFKIAQCEELHRRFGDRIDGMFVTDDWGTQERTFVSQKILNEFFVPRYAKIFKAIHDRGWHVILHSCGRINDFVPTFLDLGVDVLNMQQSRSYGLVEFGQQYRGRVCFLATVDIQSTMPAGRENDIREEARLLVNHWSMPDGGMIAFDYGDWPALSVAPEMPRVMFDEFTKLATFWSDSKKVPSPHAKTFVTDQREEIYK